MTAHRHGPGTKTAPAHTHASTDGCAVCGRVPGVECGYAIDDRLLRTLFVAVCKTMNLEAVRRGKKATLYVTAPDVATQDRLEARFRALSTDLDDKLRAVAADFVREHCGLDVPVRPRT